MSGFNGAVRVNPGLTIERINPVGGVEPPPALSDAGRRQGSVVPRLRRTGVAMAIALARG